MLQQLANGLALGSVYALFALGFTLVFGVLEIITLAHGAVFMVGAFAGLIAVTKVNLGVGLLLMGMLAAGVGLAIDVVAVRPRRELHHPCTHDRHHRLRHHDHQHIPGDIRRGGLPLSL